MTTATQGGEDGSDTESGCCTGTCHIVRVGGVRQGLCACCGSRLGCRRACCLCGSQVLRRVGVARGTLRLLRVVDLLHGIVDCLQGIVVSLCLLEVIGGLLLVFGSGVVGVLGILDLCEVFLAGIGGVLNLLELVLPIGEVGICDVGIEACRICEDLVCIEVAELFGYLCKALCIGLGCSSGVSLCQGVGLGILKRLTRLVCLGTGILGCLLGISFALACCRILCELLSVSIGLGFCIGELCSACLSVSSAFSEAVLASARAVASSALFWAALS